MAVKILGMLLAVLVLAGCGGGSSTTTGATSPTVSPSPKAYVESATCRRKLGTFLDIAHANEQAVHLDYNTFSDRYDRLQATVDSSLLACSAKIAVPVRRGMVEYGLVSFSWGSCTVFKCPKDLIRAHLQKGAAAFDGARQLLLDRQA